MRRTCQASLAALMLLACRAPGAGGATGEPQATSGSETRATKPPHRPAAAQVVDRAQAPTGPPAPEVPSPTLPAARLFPQPDEIDSDEGWTAQLARHVAAARDGVAERFVLELETTVDYGCHCPPFVFSEPGLEGPVHLMPLFETKTDAYDHRAASEVGTYLFWGRFDGRQMTGVQWLLATGRDPGQLDPDERDSYWSTPAPVFVVDRWCFVLPEDSLTAEDLAERPDIEALLERMRAAGVELCNGDER